MNTIYTNKNTEQNSHFKEKYLLFDGSKVYFRIRVPSDLKDTIKQKDIKRLLPCKSRSSILKFRNMLFNQSTKLFETIRSKENIDNAKILEYTEHFIDNSIDKLRIEYNLFEEEAIPKSIDEFVQRYDFELEDMKLINFLYKQHQRSQILKASVFEKEDSSSKVFVEDMYHEFYGGHKRSLKRLFASYVKEQNWNRIYRKDVLGGFRLFFYKFTSLDMINNKSLNQFTNNILIKYPKNANKLKATKDFNIEQRVLIAKEQKLELLSIRSIEKYIQWYNLFLKWLYENDHTNQVYTIKQPKIKHTVAPNKRRLQYSPSDLKRLFSSPVYENSSDFKIHQKMIPIISLYSGMRLQEVCQLEREDIIKVDGVLCFSINSKSSCGQKKWVKSFSGHRIIPIHSKLFELGIVEYFLSIKNGKIWKELNSDRYGKYNTTYGKQFQRINNRYILKDTNEQRKSFHSLRHTFAYKLKQAHVDEKKISELLGHANKSVTSIYTKGFSAKILKKEIEKLKFTLNISL
jgi:integrase